MSAALLFISSVCTLGLAAFAPPDSAGPLAVTTLTVSIPRGRGAMPGILYRPVQADHGAEPRPAVIFGHGYFAAASRYDSICRRLASHGFCVLAPENPDPGLLRSLAPAAEDMQAAIDFVESLARLPEMHIDPQRVALAGHSMGGGAAFLDAQRNRSGNVRAVIGLAPYRISTNVHPESLGVPALILTGSNDRSAPPAVIRREFYDPCPAPCYLALLREGGHNGFLDLDQLAGRPARTI